MISTPRRRARALPVVAALLVTVGWCSTGIAHADVSSFVLSPKSGPPGTVVSVSGTGCSPGPTNSESSDYVAVAAPTLQLYDKHIRVRKNGSWHGTFKVPSDANAGLAAAVAALCVSDTLPSLTTWYRPQTFTVTAPPTTTTTARGGTTPTTPTTKKSTGTTPPTHDERPGPDGGGGPGSTVPVFGGLPPDTSGGNAGGGTDRGGSDGGGSATSRPGTTRAGLNRATRGMPAARAADLSVPRLPGAHVAGASGLGWIAWVLLALVIAALGAPFWLRRSRRSDEDEDDGAAVVEAR